MFISEVIAKSCVVWDFIILKGVPNIFVLPIYIHEQGRILESPLNIMQSSTAPGMSMNQHLYHGVKILKVVTVPMCRACLSLCFMYLHTLKCIQIIMESNVQGEGKKDNKGFIHYRFKSELYNRCLSLFNDFIIGCMIL